jgi:hypothetical protein
MSGSELPQTFQISPLFILAKMRRHWRTRGSQLLPRNSF